jgi:type VI secretion system protein ImpL
VLPIYVLFTKCDLVAGFNEFFGDLRKNERGQIWGFTVPLAHREHHQPGASSASASRSSRTRRPRMLRRIAQERRSKRGEPSTSFPSSSRR